MKPVRVQDGSALGKFEAIVGAFDVWDGVVVDVGCRSRELAKVLGDRCTSYIGVDLGVPADVIADIGAGLPFDDAEMDVVVALDVLEHTDDIHFTIGELMRVAARHVVISLPNCYVLSIRSRVLRGQPISGKYGLPSERPSDRHRWFFSLDEARLFVSDKAHEHGWTVVQDGYLVGPRWSRVMPLVTRWPNLLSPTYVSLLAPSLTHVR